MNSVIDVCKKAKEASINFNLSAKLKNEMLDIISDALVKNSSFILHGNEKDLKENADKPEHILDRLSLNENRISAMAEGLRQLKNLQDPIGEVIDSNVRPNGMRIQKVRVPLGVIGIIYEARPNVTIDAIGLCLKTGNCVVLRGSKDAINSNKALVEVVKAALLEGGHNADFIQLVEDTTHEGAETLMKCRRYVDVLMPRGSANLINTVIEKSSIPVIETGTGNCHAYVNEFANLQMAEDIVLNGKLTRPSVCNALESLLVDEKIAEIFLPTMLQKLENNGVEIYGCPQTKKIYSNSNPATEDDFYKEYLGLKISVKVVKDFNEAINHVNKYSTKHSDVIITENADIAKDFLSRVDSACVYHNVSTRFTDGFEFGFGAEMGISTQKIHARGPLGLKQLTSEKYLIEGCGQIRI